MRTPVQQLVACTRLVAATLLSVVVGALAVGSVPATATAAPRAGLEPGELVITDQAAGQVLRVSSSGQTEVLVDDLESVRGVMVLSDGAVLAADSDAGVVVGTGGRYGTDRVAVASGLAAPEALAPAGDDRIYVSSFSEGTLSRVDLGSGQVETLSAGLAGPVAVIALRPPRASNRMAVAEWFGGSVAVLKANGDRASTLADDFARPAGLATDGDGTIYVTDRDAGTVVAIDQEGQQRTVVEANRPGGISLDPAQPAAGQSYELVVATTDGVVRVDPESGATSPAADVTRAVGVTVAPDEFITPGATTDVSVVEAAGTGPGGDVVAAQGDDIDYTLVGLVALSVVLAGVAIVTGVQLVRSRGGEEEGAPMSRKERRRAEKADKAVQAAERKTAREVLKAEKRAAKMAPPEPAAAQPASPAVAPPPSPLFLGDPAPDEPVAPIPDAAPTPSSDQGSPARSTRADRAAAKAAAAAAAAQAKAEAKDAAARAKAEAKADKARAERAAQQAKADAKAATAQAKADAKAAKSRTSDDARRSGAAGPLLDPLDPTPSAVPGDAALLAAGMAAAPADDAIALPPAADDPRQPLFAAPSAPSHTPGPFLESLFTPTEPGSEPVGGADQGATGPPLPPPPAPPSPAPPTPEAPTPEAPTPPTALEPVQPPLPAQPPAAPVPHRPLALPESTSTGSITDLVARSVAPPSGLFGRRKAKRRHRAAEHRHRQLRAITAITDVPPVAPPPTRQGAIELAERGIAPAASVAVPNEPAAPAAIESGWVEPD